MRESDQSPALLTNSVSKRFGGVQAVRSVDFVVPVGERRALIGPNGAGKTTLFNLITGELDVDKGQILIYGEDVTNKSVQQRARFGLGRTYQISQLLFDLSVEENLFLAGSANRNITFGFFKPWKKYKEEIEWAHQVAEQVKLTDYLGSKVSDISHGLQRQLEIGMAISMHPRLIMLDEPAAGLSPSERIVLIDLIKELTREVTLILIEHDMDVVLDIADKITVLHRGEIIAEDTPSLIKQNTEVQSVYLGSSYDRIKDH